MLIVIRCVTCNKVLADKWDYFERESAKLEAQMNEELKSSEDGESGAEKKKKPEMKNMTPTTMGKILDDLGLTRICCRRHMISNRDLMDLI
jgi:DNA-directed RNA polymerase subunit N (RpoN/RPB10)